MIILIICIINQQILTLIGSSSSWVFWVFWPLDVELLCVFIWLRKLDVFPDVFSRFRQVLHIDKLLLTFVKCFQTLLIGGIFDIYIVTQIKNDTQLQNIANVRYFDYKVQPKKLNS